MVSTIAVTEAIADLNQAHRQFNLSRTLDPAFFSEWRADLPVLTETEKGALDRYRDAMITTGEDYTFIKLDRREKPTYALSYKFTLLSDENNNLYRVAQVIKRIARVLV